MPDILHRISIDAPLETVHDLLTTTEGVAHWWTGRPVVGSTAPGDRFEIRFGDSGEPAAVMELVSDAPHEVVWRVVAGPDSWLGTTITFTLRAAGTEGTTLLFAHAGWQEAGEFMSGCSTNWGAYLTSLKSRAEGHGFAAYPAGEISRWN